MSAWRSASWLAATDRRFLPAVAACLVVIGAWFYGYERTYLALRLITWDDAIFFDRLPLYVAIVMLLSLCIRRLERETMRRLVTVIVAIFAMYALAELAAPIPLPLFADELSGATDGPAEVTQSTGWSCGAAALAWATRLHGVPASERQMAELAVTAPLRGTSTRGMLRALHRVGLEAQAIKPASWEDLDDIPGPALIGWKLTPTVAHAAVLLAVEGDEVIVGDPLCGQMRYEREEFMQRWLRDLIVISAPDKTSS
ncbi:MAG: hypothetical protein GX131_13040 [candidate division WS1 bacterium]|nr:hypothetical protein [candidate division WS1 bacterium]